MPPPPEGRPRGGSVRFISFISEHQPAGLLTENLPAPPCPGGALRRGAIVHLPVRGTTSIQASMPRKNRRTHRCDECRRPRRDAPAADKSGLSLSFKSIFPPEPLTENLPAPPCPARGPEAGSHRKHSDFFSDIHCSGENSAGHVHFSRTGLFYLQTHRMEQRFNITTRQPPLGILYAYPLTPAAA